MIISNSWFFYPALKLASVEQDIACDVDASVQSKLGAYPQIDDHDASTCHTFYFETSKKHQILYSITNAVSSKDFDNFRVTYGNPFDDCVHVAFIYHRRNGDFQNRECSAIRGSNQFILKCALECASVLRILMQLMPGCQSGNLSLCHVELVTPGRSVEPNSVCPWMSRHIASMQYSTFLYSS